MLNEIENPAAALDEWNKQFQENEVSKMRAELAENAEKELREAQLEARNLETQRMTDGFRSIPALAGISEDVACIIALFVSSFGNEQTIQFRGDWLNVQTWMVFLAPLHWVRAIAETAMYNIVTGVSVRFLEWREWKSKQS